MSETGNPIGTVVGVCARCAWDVYDTEDYFIEGPTVQHERCYDDDSE